MRDDIKMYYQNEIDKIETPPIPKEIYNKEKKREVREIVKLISCIAATFLVLLSPLNRTSPIREIEITENSENNIKEGLTAGLLGGMKYFNEKRRMYE